MTAGILLFGTPPKQCPNWHLLTKAHASLWEFFPLTVFAVSARVFLIVRWNWAAQKVAEQSITGYPTMLVMTAHWRRSAEMWHLDPRAALTRRW